MHIKAHVVAERLVHGVRRIDPGTLVGLDQLDGQPWELVRVDEGFKAVVGVEDPVLEDRHARLP